MARERTYINQLQITTIIIIIWKAIHTNNNSGDVHVRRADMVCTHGAGDPLSASHATHENNNNNNNNNNDIYIYIS